MLTGMTRAAFAAAIVLGVWGLPHVARAQPARPIARIGMLETTSAGQNAANLAAFRQGLRDLGYVEAEHFVLEYRSADGRAERFAAFASELIRLNVDVIVTRGTPAVLAARKATATIPIVSAAMGDPVGAGVAATLARPGGNVTGLSAIVGELEGKRLALLMEVSPRISRVARLHDRSNPAVVTAWGNAQAAARALGLVLHDLDVRNADDLEPALQRASKERIDAVLVTLSPLTQGNVRRIAELMRQYRLPSVSPSREFVEAGGLIAYGVHYPELYRRAAVYIDKILKGTRPGDLPVEQPTKFDLVINMRTARTLGLVVPTSLVLRADEVIQ